MCSSLRVFPNGFGVPSVVGADLTSNLVTPAGGEEVGVTRKSLHLFSLFTQLNLIQWKWFQVMRQLRPLALSFLLFRGS